MSPQPPQAAKPSSYWVFVSYSHKDQEWAEWLYRKLSRYRIPRDLRGRKTVAGEVPATLVPIFLDREEMAAGPDLPHRIERALEAARSLLVISSPAAESSNWVRREIGHFSNLGKSGRTFAVSVSQDGSAVAKTLLGVSACADLNPEGDGRRKGLLKVIAAITGLPESELVRFHRRRLFARAGTALAVLLCLAAASAAIWDRSRARAEAADILKALQFNDFRNRAGVRDPSALERIASISSYGVRRRVEEVILSDPTASRDVRDIRAEELHALAGLNTETHRKLAIDLLPQYCYDKIPEDDEIRLNCDFAASVLDDASRSLPFLVSALAKVPDDKVADVGNAIPWWMALMAPRLTGAQTLYAANSILLALSRASDVEKSELGRPLFALTGHLHGNDAEQLATTLLTHMQGTSDAEAIAAMGEALAGLPRGEAGSEIQTGTDIVVHATLANWSKDEGDRLLQALALLAPHLGPEAAWAVVEKLTEQFSLADQLNTGTGSLGVALGALCRRLDPDHAHQLLPAILNDLTSPVFLKDGPWNLLLKAWPKQYMTAQQRAANNQAMRDMQDEAKQELLGPVLAALAPHTNAAQRLELAQWLQPRLNAALTGDMDQDRIRFLTYMLAAACGDNTRSFLQRTADRIAAQMRSVKSDVEAAELAESYLLLANACEKSQTDAVVSQLLGRLEHGDWGRPAPDTIAALAEFASRGLYRPAAEDIGRMFHAAEDESDRLRVVGAIASFGNVLSDDDAEKVLSLAVASQTQQDSSCPAAAKTLRLNTLSRGIDLLNRPESTLTGEFPRCDELLERIGNLLGTDPSIFGTQVPRNEVDQPTTQQPNWYRPFAATPRYYPDELSFLRWAERQPRLSGEFTKPLKAVAPAGFAFPLVRAHREARVLTLPIQIGVNGSD